MLPSYSRMGAGPSGTGQISAKFLTGRRALRTRERFLILLLLATLGFVCFGGLFYLPDNIVSTDKVRKAYESIQSAGDMFIPAPPVANRRHRHGADGYGFGNENDNSGDEAHVLPDRNRLQAKIQNDLLAGGADHLEKPQAKANEAPVMNAPSPENVNVDNGNAANAGNNDNNANAVVHENVGESAGVAPAPEPFSNLPTGEDKDPIARQRRNKVKEVIKW